MTHGDLAIRCARVWLRSARLEPVVGQPFQGRGLAGLQGTPDMRGHPTPDVDSPHGRPKTAEIADLLREDRTFAPSA